MPQLDKAKEEIGWLKVIFAITIATDLSLMAYLGQHYNTQEIGFTVINIIMIIFATIIAILTNKKAYKKIDEIGEL